jgi:glycosyltransferase involved in cell wall biosynthesis
LISVIIPWRNTPLTDLWEALESIKRQTVECGIETIIVDDGSEPAMANRVRRSLQALSTEDRCFQVVVASSPSGISAARNLGVERSHGDYIAWLDADDQLENKALATLRQSMRETGARAAVGDCVVLYPGGHERRFSAPYFGCLHEEFCGTIHDPWQTVVFAIHPQLLQRTVVEDVGGFDERYEWAEMTEFFLRVLHAARPKGVHHVEEPLYRYSRMHPDAHSRHRIELEHYRQKALLSQARRAGCDLDRLVYVGRESTTGAQHYVPSIGGSTIWSPYLVVQHPEGRAHTVDLRHRYMPATMREMI